jgi:hypothetical protein
MEIKHLLYGLILVGLLVLPVLATSQTDTILYVEYHGYSTGQDTNAFYWNRTLNRTPVSIVYDVAIGNSPGNIGQIYRRLETWYTEFNNQPKVHKMFDLSTTLEVTGNLTGDSNPQNMKGTLTLGFSNLSMLNLWNLTEDYGTTCSNKTILWQTFGLYPYQIIPATYGTINETYKDYLKSNHGFMIFAYDDSAPFMELGTSSSHVISSYAEGGNIYNVTTGNPCNLTAITQNTANGNAVSGSTFHIYDITKGTSESFYLPYGAGSVSIPYMNDYYASNATKSGYTGYPAFPLGTGWQIPGSSTTCAGTTLYAQLTGPPQSATNGTLTFFVHDNSDYPLAIPGASVILNTGQVATTNLAGTAVFNLLILNKTYNYSVTKPAYFPVDGDVIISTSGVYVEVELTQGIQPTATVTVTPTTTATAMRTCSYGDLNCAFDESMKFIGSGVQFLIQIGYYIMVLTLLWMFIYAATGEIPGYKRNKGGGRGGSLFGNVRWK